MSDRYGRMTWEEGNTLSRALGMNSPKRTSTMKKETDMAIFRVKIFVENVEAKDSGKAESLIRKSLQKVKWEKEWGEAWNVFVVAEDEPMDEEGGN